MYGIFLIVLLYCLVSDTTGTILLNSEDDFRIITSPGYPDNYPHDAFVVYTILSPEGTHIRLDILEFLVYRGCYEDVMYIYDGK